MSYLKKAEELYGMIGQGQLLEAFDKFYDDKVVMTEATGDVREGKAKNKAFLQKWEQGIKEQHGGGVHAITSNEDAKTTMVESWTDVTFQDGNRMKMTEIAVQQWNDDNQIVKERFYYDTRGME